MPNAWSDYLYSLLGRIAFVISGLIVFRRFARRYRGKNEKKYRPDAGCLGILSILFNHV